VGQGTEERGQERSTGARPTQGGTWVLNGTPKHCAAPTPALAANQGAGKPAKRLDNPSCHHPYKPLQTPTNPATPHNPCNPHTPTPRL